MWANRTPFGFVEVRMEESSESNREKDENDDVKREEWNKRRYGICKRVWIRGKVTFQIAFHFKFIFDINILKNLKT